MSLRKITPLKRVSKDSETERKPVSAKRRTPRRPERRPIGG
ncbi:hypothetical protein ACFRKB_26155 [Streptomyces scopuliridis]